jgi:inosose dehydratase
MNFEGIRLGCQTNAWQIDPNSPETLYESIREIRQLGFSGFETGFRNILPIANRRERLSAERHGLIFFGVHIFLHEYDPETLIAPMALVMKVAEGAAELGVERLILSGAPSHAEIPSLKARALNEIGARIRPLALELAYHNHGPEFVGPKPEIEALLSGTDPALVSFVLDAGHVFLAQADISTVITCHFDRLAGVHLRDFKEGRQVPLGQGDFPLEQVARALNAQSWSGWVLAEEERADGSKLGQSAACGVSHVSKTPTNQAMYRAAWSGGRLHSSDHHPFHQPQLSEPCSNTLCRVVSLPLARGKPYRSGSDLV